MSKDFWQEIKNYIKALPGSSEEHAARRQILNEMRASERRWTKAEKKRKQKIKELHNLYKLSALFTTEAAQDRLDNQICELENELGGLK